MLVPLPSGYAAELDAPSIKALLASGGRTAAIAESVWSDEGASTLDLSDADIYAVAFWAVCHIAEDADSKRLLRQCLYLGGLPSERIGFVDRALAFEFDDLFVPPPDEAPRDDSAQGDDEHGGRVRFTTGGPE